MPHATARSIHTHTHTQVYAHVYSPGAEASTASHIRRADSMSVPPLGSLSHPEETAETRQQGLEPTQSDQRPAAERSRMEPETGIVDPQVSPPGTKGRGAGGRGGCWGARMNILVLDTLPLRWFIPFLPISLPDSPLVLKCVRKGLFESLLGSASSCQSKLIMLLLPEDDCTSLPALCPKPHSFCEGCGQFHSGEEERGVWV